MGKIVKSRGENRVIACNSCMQLAGRFGVLEKGEGPFVYLLAISLYIFPIIFLVVTLRSVLKSFHFFNNGVRNRLMYYFCEFVILSHIFLKYL